MLIAFRSQSTVHFRTHFGIFIFGTTFQHQHHSVPFIATIFFYNSAPQEWLMNVLPSLSVHEPAAAGEEEKLGAEAKFYFHLCNFLSFFRCVLYLIIALFCTTDAPLSWHRVFPQKENMAPLNRKTHSSIFFKESGFAAFSNSFTTSAVLVDH